MAVTGTASAAVPCPDVDIDDIPNHFVSLYQGAAEEWGLAWEFLAAIGWIETRHGQCCGDCAVSSAGARGPMQFIDSTWATWGYDANNNGTVNRCEPADAIYSAARYLVNIGAPGNYRQAAGNYYGACVDNYCDAALCLMNKYQNQSGGGGGGGGDGGSGGPNVIRLKGRTNTDYSFHTTGDINRQNAEAHDKNLYISGNNHDEIQGRVGAGNWDAFNYAGILAWIDTPSIYIDIDRNVIRFTGNAGSGRSNYTFHTTGGITKLPAADGTDTHAPTGNNHDEIEGFVLAGGTDAFRFNGKLAWIDTPDLYIDVDQA